SGTVECGREVASMEAVQRLCDAAMTVAADDDDLSDALRQFVTITRDGPTLERAVIEMAAAVARTPTEATIARAHALLIAASKTQLYSPGTRPAGGRRTALPPRSDRPKWAPAEYTSTTILDQPLGHPGDVAVARARLVEALARLHLSVPL